MRIHYNIFFRKTAFPLIGDAIPAVPLHDPTLSQPPSFLQSDQDADHHDGPDAARLSSAQSPGTAGVSGQETVRHPEAPHPGRPRRPLEDVGPFGLQGQLQDRAARRTQGTRDGAAVEASSSEFKRRVPLGELSYC